MNGDAIIAAARDGGALAMERWREGQQPDCKVWEKKPGHPVCDIDLAVDDLLKERLCAILPEAGWLSEETTCNIELPGRFLRLRLRREVGRHWLLGVCGALRIGFHLAAGPPT